jgi:hypothetical protein
MNAAQGADFAAADSEYKQIQSKLDTANKLKEAEQQRQQQITKLMLSVAGKWLWNCAHAPRHN